jgi:hypothetical protein
MVNGNIWQVIMALIRFSGENCRGKQMIYPSRHWIFNQSLFGVPHNLTLVHKILELPGLGKCCCRTLSQVESCLF